MKETLKKIPWSWVLTIICMIACQLAAMQLVVLPALMSFFLAIFTPPVLILSGALIVIPGMLSITSWITLFVFRWRVASLILSVLALGIGLFADWGMDQIFKAS